MKNIARSLLLASIIACSFVIYISQPAKEVSLNQMATLEPDIKINKQDKPGEMMAFELERQKNPTLGKIPDGAPLRAYQHVRKIAKNSNKAGLLGVTWEERGPDNVGGRTRALMFDPNDGTNKKVWAGAVGGGIWYNNDITDASSSWNAVDDFMGSLAVSCLAYDPSSTSTFYAGTGEGYFNSDAQQGLGVWKSTDGGVTWNQLASTIPSSTGTDAQKGFRYVQDIAVASNGDVFAATRGYYNNRGGLLKSTDGGSTWSDITPAAITSQRGSDIEFAANGDLYVTFGIFNQGYIYRSDDNGATWANITPAIFGADNERIELAIAPSASATTGTTVIYALSSSSSNSIEDMVVSTDGGTNWSSITIPSYINQDCSVSGSSDFTRGQAWYDLIAAVKPDDATTLIVGGVDLFRSTDSGTTWTRISDWADRGCSTEKYAHADQHQIQFRPGSNVEFIVGNDGGVFHAADITTFPVDFDARVKDYNVTQFYAADLAQTSASNEILAGAQDNGTQYFTAAGINSTSELTGGDGAFCFFDDDDDSDAVTAYVYNNLYFFVNGGYNAQLSQNTGRFINPSDLDSDNDILYSADNANKYRATDYDANTTVYTPGLDGGTASAITVSPHTANTIFIGTSAGKIYKISNANTAPAKTVIPVTGVPSAYISCIAVGSDDDELVVTISSYGEDHVLYTSNGGTSWTDKSDNLTDMPVYWALINPNNSDEVLIATEYGVWSTTSLTGTPAWAITSTGLANVRCDMIRYRASDNTAVVATHGRGVFTANVFNTTSDWISATNDGDWNNAANWDLGREPIASDDITLDHIIVAPGYTVTVTADAAIGNLTFDDADINLVIEAGVTFGYSTISGNGNITLEEGASLVPNAGQSGTVSGNFTVKRNKPSGQNAAYYNFWSSPVTAGNTNMMAGAQNVYSLAKGAGSESSYYSAFSGLMTNGRGYAATNVTTATFTGTVNNGNINYAIEDNSGGGAGVFNLTGNPYPSAISASTFVSDNVAALLDATVYLWSQLDANDRTDSENSIANFIAVNAAGISAYDQDATLAATNIASGQGFGVAAASSTNISFNNDQRNGNNSDFKSDKTLRSAEYAWFAIEQNKVEQPILIAFGEQATTGSDFYYDAHSFKTENNLQLAAMIKDELFLIDALPLNQEETRIPLSVTVPEAGKFSISFAKEKNLNESRNVYLLDKETNSTYDLKETKTIEFEAAEASFWQNRFELYFHNSTVGIDHTDDENRWIQWTSSQGRLKIQSLNDKTTAIHILDASGKLVKVLTLEALEIKTISLATGTYILKSQAEANIIKAFVQ
tara:strand:+ start:136127 stop:140053 length:3927 start_codon:yes stop_codon:yes gene_type:complete